MRSRVKITDTKYFVNSQKGTVVCALHCDLQLRKHPSWTELYCNMWRNLPIDNDGEFDIRAVAKCSPHDAFDEETGKRLAEARAKEQAFLMAKLFYKQVCEYFLKVAKHLRESEIACATARQKEKAHIGELLQGV